MKSKNVGAIILIVLGISFLVRNLNFLPRPGVIWPVVLIILGLAALYQTRNRSSRARGSSGEVIVEMDGGSPLLKAIIAVPAILIALVAGLIVLGVIGPFFLLFLPLIPLILFFKLGWAFLNLLLPIVFVASPLLIIILVLALLF